MMIPGSLWCIVILRYWRTNLRQSLTKVCLVKTFEVIHKFSTLFKPKHITCASEYLFFFFSSPQMESIGL